MTQRLMCILWPSFLVAAAMVGVFFSAFDPYELHWFGEPVEISRLGVYTITFFLFWIMGAACGAASLFLISTKGTPPER
jgi:hypothetical protein